MRRCRFLLWALALALVLTGCGPSRPEATPSALPVESPSSDLPNPSSSPTPAPTPAALPTPTPTPDKPVWEEEHRLDRSPPALTAAGLELPVSGATGYAPVELPLWPAIPTPTPSVTPSPSAAPVPTATPAPAVVPTPAPTAAPETATGTPAVSDVPAVSPAPAVSQEPAPTPAPSLLPPSQSPAAAGPVVQLLTASDTSDPYAGALDVLRPGESFTILQERGHWWQVAADGGVGWVDHRCCLINLPDVVPSMIYDAVNARAAVYVSSGRDIPGVTGEAFYPGKCYNQRLGRGEFCMPILYAAAKRVCAAQQAALAQGNCLKLYEAYRPYETQRAVVRGLTALAQADPTVKAGVTTPPWSMTYFINTGYSNHQRGFAVDVGLVKVYATQICTSGGWDYLRVTNYQEYEMPTAIHELSMAAASTTGPGRSELTAAMRACPPALALRSYFTGAGMTPLESEWWHFNDYSARNLAAGRLSTGNFVISGCRSRAPG